MIAVTILGNNSAVPSHGRHPTAQIVQTDEHTFLIDCGEGTQMQMSRYKIKRNKISHIFISHLHGDHYFGLIGLLNSFSLTHRLTELHIYSPEKLKEIIQIQLDAANAELTFECHFHNLNEEGIIWEDDKTSVECFKVNHRIECWGFLFKEKRNPRTILPAAVNQYKVPTSFYENLQQGENFIDKNGEEIKNEILTEPGKRGRSYAFCADTSYYEPICKCIYKADLIYHETTYLDDLQNRAISRYHSTSKQAALIAKKACANKLIIGHFSSMYETVERFKEEACEIFENSEIAEEGVCYLA